MHPMRRHRSYLPDESSRSGSWNTTYQLCHGPAETPPTPPHYLHLPDGSSRSGLWNMPNTNYSYTLSYSLNVLLRCFNLCIMIPSLHMASIASVHPGEGSSSVALLKVSSLFSPWRVVWEFFLMRCEVLGQGCLCVQIVKHSETNLKFVKMGYTNKLNWIELI